MPRKERSRCCLCKSPTCSTKRTYPLRYQSVMESASALLDITQVNVDQDFICSKCFSKGRNQVMRTQVAEPRPEITRGLELNLQDSSQLESSSPVSVVEVEMPVIMEVDENMQSEPEGIAFQTEPDESSSMSAPNSVLGFNSTSDAQTETQTSESGSSNSYSSRYTAEAVRDGHAPFKLPGVKSISYSECKCCVCGHRDGRGRIKYMAIIDAWVKGKVLIPARNRCCITHLQENGLLNEEALELLKIKARVGSASINGEELAKWIFALTTRIENPKKILDFSKESELPDAEYQLLLGMSKENFNSIMEIVEGKMYNSKNRTTRDAIAMLLMTMRLNISQRVVAFLFGIRNQSIISDAISSALTVMDEHFVPLYLGFQHLTREEIMQTHMRPFYNKVLGVAEEDLIIICDGTYIYTQRPSDFLTQKKLYSLHKHCHLGKSMMIVFSSGYIWTAEGLYGADNGNNDASILRDMLRKDNNLLSVLQTRDVLVLDRGFRDVIKELEDLGVKTFMPCLLPKKRKQFSTMEANESRRVTMLRNIVERANGRIKKKFKFLDAKVPCTYIPKLGSFFKVACALINAYSPPLFTQKEYHEKIANDVLKKLKKPNMMQKKVEDMKLHLGGKTKWEEADEDCVLSFPLVTLEELTEITEGPYQIQIGELYNQQHLQSGNGYKFYYYMPENGLVRIKMKSRFSRSQKHYVWIWFKPNGKGTSAIRGYYCHCKNGSRSLGCCGHIAAVIRYLGCDRFEELRPKRNYMSYFLDAAEDAALEEVEDGNEDSDLDEIDLLTESSEDESSADEQ